MRLAIAEAAKALTHDDVPVGAVILDKDGHVIGRGHNERELTQDPSAHAELLAIREAAEHIWHWRLLETTLYVTLEPCAMCAGAIVLARIPTVVYGTPDPKAGAAGSVLDVLAEVGYDGWVELEYVHDARPGCSSCDNIQETMKFRDFVREHEAAAGR